MSLRLGATGTCVRDSTQLRILAQGRGFVCSLGGNVYLAPSETTPDFQRSLEALRDAVLATDGLFLFGGNFNTRALEWS